MMVLVYYNGSQYNYIFLYEIFDVKNIDGLKVINLLCGLFI